MIFHEIRILLKENKEQNKFVVLLLNKMIMHQSIEIPPPPDPGCIRGFDIICFANMT